jgi:hypothetical protein
MLRSLATITGMYNCSQSLRMERNYRRKTQRHQVLAVGNTLASFDKFDDNNKLPPLKLELD